MRPQKLTNPVTLPGRIDCRSGNSPALAAEIWAIRSQADEMAQEMHYPL